MAQEIRQKRDISERKSKVLTLQHGCWVTVRPVMGHLTPKMNITFFIKIRCRITFYSKSFSKKAVFSKKTVKNCFGGAFNNFLGKGGILRQKLT